MIDELARSKNCRHEFRAIHKRVETRLEQADQVLGSVAFAAGGFNEGRLELFFRDVAIVEFEFLLGHQLHTKVRDLVAAVRAMLAWTVWTFVDGRLWATPDVLTDTAINLILRRVTT